MSNLVKLISFAAIGYGIYWYYNDQKTIAHYTEQIKTLETANIEQVFAPKKPDELRVVIDNRDPKRPVGRLGAIM